MQYWQRKLGKGGQAQRYMVSEVRRKTDPYVPFLNGPLKNTAVEHENLSNMLLLTLVDSIMSIKAMA